MSAAHETGELSALVSQGHDHVERLRELVGSEAPPEVAAVERAIAATRALRGSASLVGLDPFQHFLGRLFQLLDDVESHEVPWSASLDAVLREAELAETSFVADLESGAPQPSFEKLAAAETALADWRREAARRRPDAAASSEAQREMSQSAASGGAPSALDAAAQQVQHLRATLETPAVLASGGAPDLEALQHELAKLQELLAGAAARAGRVLHRSEEGLRNHCEGALHHIVEAAAREVLDEARERGLPLSLRVTGHLQVLDEALGSTLLEVLSHLWRDCLEAVPGAATRLDTVLREDGARLVLEVRDLDADGTVWRRDEDVLGLYPGLRRSRPIVEALDGLIWVEPEDAPGCRFRLALPLATEQPHVTLVRVGQHDIALPPSAIDGVHDYGAVRTSADGAGAFVEVGTLRVPILHLGFLLGDVSFDELLRERVVVVGSFERRAAFFTRGPERAARGQRTGEAQGAWAGSIETQYGTFPLLSVGALLGRQPSRALAAPGTGKGGGEASERHGPGTLLLVDSSEVEREILKGMLGEAGYRVLAVPSAEEAWNALGNQMVDLVLCDLRLPQMNAQQVCERLQRSAELARTPVVLVLSHVGEQSHLVVRQLGANAYVRSPVHREELLGVVKRLAGEPVAAKA